MDRLVHLTRSEKILVTICIGMVLAALAFAVAVIIFDVDMPLFLRN